MKLNNLVEMQDGKMVRFEGELEGEELQYVLELGLRIIFLQGALNVAYQNTSGEVH